MWPYNVLTYSSATTEFAYDSSNQYNWNGVDRYICDSEKEYSELTEVSEGLIYTKLVKM